jgi:interferon gamma-inducible protein 30
MMIPTWGRNAALLTASILLCWQGIVVWRGSTAQEELQVGRDADIRHLQALSRASMTSHESSLWAQSEKGTRVRVQVSLEALCIDCQHFVLEQLVPTWNELSSAVLDLEVVIFGNSHLSTATQTVTCQHGAAECDANVYEQCAIDNYPYPDRYLPFLECLYTELPMGKAVTPFAPSLFATCARRAALDVGALQACHAHDSWPMQVQSAAKTPKDHDHVPWVVVEGQYVSEEHSFQEVVCEAYRKKGGRHAACVGL